LDGPIDAEESWTGRDVFDANGQRIGTVAGRAHARKRFGVTWLRVRIDDGRLVLAPAEQMQSKGERLVLPYGRAYVEAAPGVSEGEASSREADRRLGHYYGIGSGGVEGGCRVGCGLCMANKRQLRRAAREGGSDEST
jgi:hypothetical protein